MGNQVYMHSQLDLNTISIDDLLESLDDFVFELSKDGTIIHGWASEKHNFFLSPPEFTGKNIDVLFPPELAATFLAAIDQINKTGLTQEVEYKSPYENKYFSARFHQLKSTDHLMVLIRDVTKIHEIQSQIALSEHRFRNLSKHSTDITTIIQPDGIIKYQSESYNRLFGYTESIVGHNIFEYIHPEDHEMVVAEIKLGVEKGGVSDLLEFRYKHADGRWIYVESRGNNLLHEPGIEGIVVNSRDISDRKSAELKLIQNEARYRNLLHNSMDIITVLNEKGEVMLDSFSILTQFGYDKPLEGNSIFDYVHPDDLEAAQSTFVKYLQQPGITEPFEFRFRAADGSWRYVEAIGNNLFADPSINGFVINSRDITERKRMQNALDMSNARFAAILESTQDVVFAIDTHYNYLAFNKAHQQIIKDLYDIDLEVGKSALIDHKDLPRIDREAMKLLFNRSLRGERFTHIYDLNNPKSSIKYIEISLNPIKDEQNQIVGVAVFSKDVTAIKEAQNDLINARNEAVAAANAKSEFLSNMSHEIRTPMNAIIGMTDLLLEKITEEETREYLKSIKFSSDNLLVVINDILDFSKIEAGKVALEYIDFNIRNKLDEIKKLFQIKASEKNLVFETNIDPNIPKFINGDPYRLNQIIFNLLGNAIKFTNKGFVQLNTKLVGEDEHNIRIAFEIKDSGIGIPVDKKESIFESFSQAYSDTTRKFGGTGLGLAITKKLVYLLGGTIQLESTSLVGSKFTVEIPYNKSTFILEPHDVELVDLSTHNYLKGLNVLVAEDNTINQFLIQQTLAKWECNTTITGNGHEAIELLKEKNFDLILMDLQMPEMNGYEATRLIRSKNTTVKNPTIPIIALTADAFPETKRKVLETGMNDFVAKPFNRNELQIKITKLCVKHF